MLFIEVDYSLRSSRVIWVLRHLVNRYGKPKKIRMDNGPEFVAKLAQAWSKANEIQFKYILVPARCSSFNDQNAFAWGLPCFGLCRCWRPLAVLMLHLYTLKLNSCNSSQYQVHKKRHCYVHNLCNRLLNSICH